MKLSDKGLMALISHEGIVQSRYKDSVGIWTIGVGHTAAAGGIDPAKFTGTLTMREVFDMLRVDVAKYEAAVSKAVKVTLSQHQFDALVSFHYNTGAIGKASLVKRLNAGDHAGAAKGFDAWVKPAEIKPRRMAEKALFLTGNYPPPFATLYPATPQGKVLWGSGKRVDLAKALFLDASSAIKEMDDLVYQRPVEVKDKPVSVPHETPKSNWLSALIAAIARMLGRK